MSNIKNYPRIPKRALQSWEEFQRRAAEAIGYLLGHMDEVRDRLLTWLGPYDQASLPYDYHDIVRDGDWTMVCIEPDGCTGRPAPQPVGLPEFGLADVPAWVGTPSDNSVVESALAYTFTKSGWFGGIRIWPGQAGGNAHSKIIVIDITNPAFPLTLKTFEDPIMFTGQWNTIWTSQGLVSAGTVLLINLMQYESSEGVPITGGWRLGSINGGVPATGGWEGNSNVDANIDVVRVSNTDLDGTGRGSELSGIIEFSTIQFVQTDDTTRSISFTVPIAGTATDNGADHSIDVQFDAIGSGGRPNDGAVTTMNVFIPVSVPTEYVEIPNYYPAGNPTFATVQSALEYNGVDQGVIDSAFGVDILFQEASISPDWELMGYSG